MASEWRVRTGWEQIDTRTGWADAIDRGFYEVYVPHMGDLWSDDRSALTRWLRRAADQIDELPDAPAFDPGD